MNRKQAKERLKSLNYYQKNHQEIRAGIARRREQERLEFEAERARQKREKEEAIERAKQERIRAEQERVRVLNTPKTTVDAW